MTKKPELWLDLDGVVGEFEQHFLRYFNLPTHHPTEWDDPRFTDNIHHIDYNDDFWLTIALCFGDLLYTL